MILFLGRFPYFVDLPPESGEKNNDVVFLCQRFYEMKESDGVQEIDHEDHKESDDGDIVARQIRYEIQHLQHGFVHDEIIDRADDAPEKGVQRADNATEVEPVIRVIPEPHIQLEDEDISCDQLDNGHDQYHQQQYQNLCAPALRIHARKCDEGHHIQDGESGTVERKPWTPEEPGIHPFLRLADGRHKMAVEEFDDPPADAAEDKDKCNSL